jgi:hypothetical protein
MVVIMLTQGSLLGRVQVKIPEKKSPVKVVVILGSLSTVILIVRGRVSIIEENVVAIGRRLLKLLSGF